jgi:hypothetical protein
MIDMYPATAGCRLDSNPDENTGRALDLYPINGGKPHATLWIRDDDGFQVKIMLEPNDLVALRNGLNRTLVEFGVERAVMVNV